MLETITAIVIAILALLLAASDSARRGHKTSSECEKAKVTAAQQELMRCYNVIDDVQKIVRTAPIETQKERLRDALLRLR